MKIKFPLGELVIKPLVSVAAMAASVLLIAPLFNGSGKLLSVAVPIIAGAAVYFVVLILVRGIDEDDISLLPKADKLTHICKKLKIIR